MLDLTEIVTKNREWGRKFPFVDEYNGEWGVWIESTREPHEVFKTEDEAKEYLREVQE